MAYRMAVDTGGTFTDFVLADATGLRIHKVPSTPDDPSLAILQGVVELGLGRSERALVVRRSGGPSQGPDAEAVRMQIMALRARPVMIQHGLDLADQFTQAAAGRG